MVIVLQVDFVQSNIFLLAQRAIILPRSAMNDSSLNGVCFLVERYFICEIPLRRAILI